VAEIRWSRFGKITIRQNTGFNTNGAFHASLYFELILFNLLQWKWRLTRGTPSLRGSGILKHSNAAPFANSRLNHLARDAKYREMIAYLFKDSASTTFIFIAFWNGQRRVLRRTVRCAVKSGWSKTDEMIIANLMLKHPSQIQLVGKQFLSKAIPLWYYQTIIE